MDTKILREQIGFNTLAAVGAHDFIEPMPYKPALTFRVGVRPSYKYVMDIQLNGRDLYDVFLRRCRRNDVLFVAQAKDVFCENISEVVYRMCHPIGQKAEWFEAVGIERIRTY